MSASSRVADHCRAYSLSSSSDPDYASRCNHQHDLTCDSCNLFPTTVKEIESKLENADIPQEEKEEMKFLMTQSKKNVEAWKAHVLRSINQDEARLETMNALDDKTALVVLDWAMKFIPRKYRESQSDWFGKRGLSWHISVALQKLEDNVQGLTLVHVFQKSNQDSLYALAVIDDVMQKLKATMPNLKSLHLKQDNAGCYHSATTMLGVHTLAQKHNIEVRMDFSDPQGGKGACDRKAATIKNHVRAYINAGNDVTNAEEMKRAIESNGGVSGTTTVFCAPLDIPDANPFPKWKGVSLINNIQYNATDMKVWRAYGMGTGKVVPYASFDLNETVELPTIHDLSASSNTPTFCNITARQRRRQDKSKQALPTSDTESSDNDTLFTCTEEGCIKTYQTYSSLQKHLECGKHKYALERESMLDKAMLRYARNLEVGASATDDSQIVMSTSAVDEHPVVKVTQGWALKQGGGSGNRLKESQKKYLVDLFILGESSGRKADPSEVSKSMRKARNTDGSLLFKADEFLTSQQIASFFSRLAAKKSLPSSNNLRIDDGDDDDFVAAMAEQEFEEMRHDVLEAIELRHPIAYESYNICEMAATSKLKKFSIAMLQDMCKFFELETPSETQKRKKPYIDILTEMVKSCTCSS